MGRRKSTKPKKIDDHAKLGKMFVNCRKQLGNKAHQLAIQCDAQVALIIISKSGKLFQYCSTGDMNGAVRRYTSYRCSLKFDIVKDLDEISRLKRELEQCNQTIRHMYGEDLSHLTLNDLLKLEEEAFMALTRIRQKRRVEVLSFTLPDQIEIQAYRNF
ncbi:hypothetical protein O6H91_06G074300 [Diphasiastrum complanatum]|uniref:Uncharacterized protein n=1 Tax=Diphasiastrum complanatum TaxID=34168 RepID=A0ACC2DEX1_DIPCM|nr:hypothetical protein O6H91_06G074300 [Diphasiastrum complanatum]